MGLLVAATLVVMFAMLVVSLLRPPTRIAAFVGLYLVAYASVVLVAEVAATAGLLNPNVFLLLHFALAIAAWILWNRAGGPPLIWTSLCLPSAVSRRGVLKLLRSFPSLWVLGLGVALAYSAGAILILSVPPNNVDSLAYHLSRVGYWLQHNSFYPWPTPNPGQISFPLNAEVGVLWTVLFVGTDRLAGFVQWSAAGASMAAIAGLSRLLGASRAQAIFAALLWATLPEIVLQSTTPQNDLLTGAFFASGLYLLYLGLHSRHIGALLLSSLALGLALGTKFTVLFLLPGLAATIVILYFGDTRRRATLVVTWIGASLVAFLLVGAYVFALNVLLHHHPLGSPSLRSDLGGFSASRVQMMIVNVPRHLYQVLDTTGLPDLWAEPLHGLKVRLGSEVFPLLNASARALDKNSPEGHFDFHRRAPVHEDFAGLGPLSVLVLVPAVIYQAFVALTRKEPFRGGVILISLSMLLGVSFWRWSRPVDNRYFVVAATICAPLVAPIFRRRHRQGLLQWGIVGIALVVLGWTTTHNFSKPLLGARPIWEMDSIERQTINRRWMEPVLRAVDRLIPHNSSIGVITGKGGWHRPLFGRRFGRTVLPLFPAPAIVDLGWLEEQDIDFLLVDEDSGTYVSQALAALHTIWNSGPWYILHRGEADFNEWDARLRNLLLEVDRTSVLTLDESLAQGVGIGEFTPPPWGEDYPG
nr:hypothetical protein [Anaerolineae bacterium]NIN96046.1 hypothetical protein [Anaerolineae bacterium]NIQ79076.1 hypothetical protein [Anaerolineae bacterium]